MSIKLMTDVFESDLGPTRRLVCLVYANFANDDGENSWPSVPTVGKMTGLEDRTVQNAIKSLVKDGILIADGQLLPLEKDQLLFLLQQNTYQDSLKQAEATILLQKAQLDYAQLQLDRYANLLPQKAASQTDVDNWRYQRDSAQANLRAAEAQRDLAKLNLDYTEVRAPFRGRIDRRLVDPGNFVGSGQPTVLAQLNQIDPIYVYFNVSDVDLARLMKSTRGIPGQPQAARWPVFIGLASEEGYPHRGSIDFAAISLTPTTGTLLLRGVFPNADAGILPGLYARVRVPLGEKSTFLVPQEIIGSDQRGTYVLVVNHENTVQRLGVSIGPTIGNQRAIDEGLTGKEWVVIKGIQKAVPGRKVTPEKGEPKPEKSPPKSPNPQKASP